MQEKIRSLVQKAVGSSLEKVEIESPKNEQFGDYSTNAAIILGRSQGRQPRALAEEIIRALKAADMAGIFISIEPSAQGFINFRLSQQVLTENLTEIIKKNARYGGSDIGSGKKVLIEFVSANPTGPLHIGHGRWAVIGDVTASVLSAAGHHVEREFYVNDAGEQVSKLERSIAARLAGEEVPEGGYAGHYVSELADRLKGTKKIREEALRILLDGQKQTLEKLGVRFDRWFHESELHEKGKIGECVKEIEKRELTFREGNAVWFKSSEFGDDKNRVLIKEDGTPTYFAADIAYHIDKFGRGYDLLINVWGTDHHGYVARLKAALVALGYPSEKLEIIIGQLVALYRGKELIRMSKRTGEMVTLEEVIEEIGRDATRYFLAKSSPNTHLDFDLELAKSKTLENPVYYVSYAHARIRSIIAEAEKSGLAPEGSAKLDLLSKVPERKLMVKLLKFTDEVENAALYRQPHRLTIYAEELAAIFHNYYHQYRVISDDKELSRARLTLASATSTVLRNVLKLLGIEAPERM